MCSVIDMDQNFMVTQREVQSTEEGGRRGVRVACLRQRVSGLVWFGCRGSPLYPGFPAAGWGGGGRLISSGTSIHTARWPAELRQQNQQSVSRGQLQEKHSTNQGHLRARGNQLVTGYSPEQTGSLKNPHIWCTSWWRYEDWNTVRVLH